jgi:hypothetical protein
VGIRGCTSVWCMGGLPQTRKALGGRQRDRVYLRRSADVIHGQHALDRLLQTHARVPRSPRRCFCRLWQCIVDDRRSSYRVPRFSLPMKRGSVCFPSPMTTSRLWGCFSTRRSSTSWSSGRSTTSIPPSSRPCFASSRDT